MFGIAGGENGIPRIAKIFILIGMIIMGIFVLLNNYFPGLFG